MKVDPKHNYLCVAQGEECYVLIGADASGAQEGDAGVITFTKGGPMGGYWKFQLGALNVQRN